MGVDTTAYINQAGQVARGQRDYEKLVTNQGPCYYPAGHIWFYRCFFRIFNTNENAETILKMFHIILHSVSNYLSCSLAKAYFVDQPLTVQLIQLTLLGNSKWRRVEQELFNDQVMAFFCLLSVYLLTICKRPFLASLSLTSALSMKASAIFYVPTFLGLLQYRHGIITLITCVVIMVTFQVLIAAPFLVIKSKEELIRPSKERALTYLRMSKFLGGDGKGGPGWGAALEWSIYWRFIPEWLYLSEDFLVYTKVATAFLNFWLFFVSKRALP